MYKKIIGIGLICLMAALIKHCAPFLQYIHPEDIQVFLLKFGFWAPLIYIVLFTVVPLTLFPDAVLAIASGLAFGIVGGICYTIIGALCGGTLAFFLSKSIGSAILGDKHLKHQKLHQLISNKGFGILLTLRLIPLIPFDVISYASGLSGINYRDFIVATLIGIIPGVIILVNIGAGMTTLSSPRLYISIAALICLVVLSKAYMPKVTT